MAKIDPQTNRDRVRKTLADRDRISVIVPKGTCDRIKGYGIKPATFAKDLVLEELAKLDRIHKK